jgi:hypothetical protein
MYNYLDVGEWRSLVARMVWDHEAAGSSPVSPTISLGNIESLEAHR